MLAPTSFFADCGCYIRNLEAAIVLQKLVHAVTAPFEPANLA
jgi:hypothetical protein